MSDNNPYTAPETVTPVVDVSPVVMEHASSGLRFANLLIDYVVQMAVGFIIGLGLGGLGFGEVFLSLGVLGEYGLGIGILIFYYTMMEGFWGVSLGKLITGTKVINRDGSKISFKAAFIRTLCRIIPFEAFSFLRQRGSGWHDVLSKTMVVKRW